MKKITFYSLLLIVLSVSIIGFAKTLSTEAFSTNYNSDAFSSNPLRDYVSLRPGFEESRIATCNNITVYLDALGNASITPVDIDAANTGTNFALDIDIFDCSNIGTPVMVTVTDSSDPTNPCISTVTVEDNLDPIITLIGANPLTIEACGTYTELNAVAKDNCSGDISTSILIDASAVNMNVVGSYVVTYNVTDAHTNAAVEVQRTIIVEDNTTPTITLNGAATITVEACGTYTELGATANDGCLALGAVIIGGDTVDTNTVGVYTITYNINDAEGNSAAQVIRTVTVQDTTDPTITLNGAATITVEACGTYTELGATANDGCLALGAVIIGGDTVDTNTVGVYTITYNINDAEGNSAAQVIRTVTVQD
ncbi:immunoglobulin-like domain-containing protein, partial [Bizionia myxarmorum]